MTFSLINNLTSRFIRVVGNQIAPSAVGQGRLCILIYHRILEHVDPLLESEPDVASFRWQMEALASCFNVLPLHEALDTLRNGRMPPRAVCITFDDGYRSTHDLALPILKEFNFPATVFVTTSYLDGSNMWNDRILEAVRSLPVGPLDLTNSGLGIHPISSLADRENAADKLIRAAKYLPSEQRLDLSLKLESLIGAAHRSGLMLTHDMVRTLVENGIEVGGHTVTHPILTKLDDQRAKEEIVGCKQELEAIIGKPVRLFAYPNGKVGMDYDERHVQMAKEAGYSAAFITTMGPATGQTDPYQIPRGRPWDKSQLMFKLRLLRWLAE
ncbi:polysaccharide deacetylase family protein [Solimicrobium silvestre]|uniref:Polysaccharide deacetylase n=1 Tax=Solimicrobium silvestre TaxID=2099400 RepID=A0A2S9GTC6_9BURK|nr:polysaccharide deacetylase family protein [Solimicrobium silvestre]PRC90963.1 Polysaccharide deacetylase [Solimicrobium silvestre]